MKLSSILKEVIDLYSIEQLPSKEIFYEIETESRRRFTVNLKYKDHYYRLAILPVFNPKMSAITFGKTNENFKEVDFNKLINSLHSFRVLAAIFGLIRYWIGKYNITEFEYAAEGEVRNKLYDYYLSKHFKDFEKKEQSVIDGDI